MSIHPFTKDYIQNHSRLCGIEPNKIAVDPCLEEFGDDGSITYCIRQENHEGDCHFVSPDMLDIYEFFVVYDGAVDEEFYAITIYEVNVADWLAQSCRDEVENYDGEYLPTWSVEVYNFPRTEGDSPKYKVSSEDES